MRRVLQKIDVEAFDAALSSWLMAFFPSSTRIAIDGKTLRGSGCEGPPSVCPPSFTKEGIVVG